MAETMVAERQRTNTLQLNEAYAQLQDLRTRYVVVWGGRRSGKSRAASDLLGIRAGKHHRRVIACVRKVGTTIRLSVWPRIKEMADLVYGPGRCAANKTEYTIVLPTGSEFLCLGADDPEKLKSLERVTDVWIEEATEFDEQDFNTLDTGLSALVDPPPSIWLTFNPIPVTGDEPDAQHWIQRRFPLGGEERELDRLYIEGDAALLRTNFESNAFCPEATRRNILAYRETNPALWRMWGLGLFTRLEGVILSNWDTVDASPDRPPDFYGLDFGFADDPAALVALWEGSEDYVDEVLYCPGLTNQQLAGAMAAAGLRRGQDTIIADCAEPKSIAELRADGWLVIPCLKGADYKRSAVQAMNQRKTHVTRRSVNLRREAATWCWRRDRRSGRALPIPTDGNDHGTDAWIYAKHRKASRWGAVA